MIRTHILRKLAVAIVTLVIAILHFEAVAGKGSPPVRRTSPRTSPQHSDPNSWNEERKHWDLVLREKFPTLTTTQRYVAGDRLYRLRSQLPSLSGVAPSHEIGELKQRALPAMTRSGIAYLGFVIRTDDLYHLLGNVKADFILGRFEDRLTLSPIPTPILYKTRNLGRKLPSVNFLPIEHAHSLADFIYQELADEETNRTTRQNLKAVGLGTTSGVPSVRILLRGPIRIEGTDDEWLTADEHFDDRWFVSDAFYLDGDPLRVFYKYVKWGGECAVRVNVHVHLTQLGTILVRVDSAFYEGSSFSSLEREDSDTTYFEVHYPPVKGQSGGTVSKPIYLYNDEAGGGDTAKVTINLEAAMW